VVRVRVAVVVDQITCPVDLRSRIILSLVENHRAVMMIYRFDN
jgi:hypothetical protein